jgi:hypothetical protein
MDLTRMARESRLPFLRDRSARKPVGDRYQSSMDKLLTTERF